jgi:hypothetical protein
MNAHARIDVVRRVRHFATDAGRAVDQAVDERRLRIHEDRRRRRGRRWLGPIVVLHRDHEDFSAAPFMPIVPIASIVLPVVGVRRESAPRHGRRDGHCTHRHLMSHPEHVATSDT